ncbi:MAG: hypothetical protein K2Y23_24100 [Cyanobacteria bacterium]|nr:hypothetical protein [Cyanobacteriota bacterium]
MTASKSLPARPSLDSLRKQAKKLSRDRSITLREAQLALARDYGFAGWKDLGAEVARRLGNELEWAADEAWRVIHDNDLERLALLLKDYPALLSWHGKKPDRAIALDPGLGANVDASGGRDAFINCFIDNGADAHAIDPWPAFVKQRISRAIHDGDVAAFSDGFRRAPWLLGDGHVDFQIALIGARR